MPGEIHSFWGLGFVGLESYTCRFRAFRACWREEGIFASHLARTSPHCSVKKVEGLGFRGGWGKGSNLDILNKEKQAAVGRFQLVDLVDFHCLETPENFEACGACRSGLFQTSLDLVLLELQCIDVRILLMSSNTRLSTCRLGMTQKNLVLKSLCSTCFDVSTKRPARR